MGCNVTKPNSTIKSQKYEGSEKKETIKSKNQQYEEFKKEKERDIEREKEKESEREKKFNINSGYISDQSKSRKLQFENHRKESGYKEEFRDKNVNESKRGDIKYPNNNVKYRRIKTITNEGVIVSKNVIDFDINREFLISEVNQDPYERYKTIKCLGEGSFGKVYKVMHKKTNEFRAMKVINKSNSSLSYEEEDEILKEINLLKRLDHPSIIKIYEYFNTKRKLFIITELCTGGELFDRITEVRFFTEVVAAHIMKQIFSATYFCHINNIIHRDLKPENILIENQEERKKDFFNIKIIDFGTGEVNKHKMLSEKTGTAYYIAPEVINNCYNEKCDLWSCGVILYILLCGCPPFSADTDEEIFAKIKIGKYQFKGSVWNNISEEAKDLIKELLTKDIDKRLSAKQALEHPWFQNMFSENNRLLLEYQKKNFPSTHLKEIISNIKTFRAEKKIQQAALAFIVHNLSKAEDIKELKNVFLAFDLDGDGRLTKDELIKGMSLVMTKGEAESDVERIMSVVDVDKNGFIEYEEFLRASLDKEKLLSKENIKIAFDLFDVDNSGYISKEELKNVMGKGQKDVNDNVWNSIIKEIDINSDGQISFEEFYEVMVKLIDKNVNQ